MRLDADTPDGSDLNVLKAMVLVVFLLTVGVFVAPATAGTTERVSVSSGGFEANDTSQYSAISADGRYVAFASHASNLVSDDMNDRKDVFVRDTVAARTTRVSVASDGTESNADSSAISLPSISADGRYVAFVSDASNLVAGDTNENRWGLPARDVFVHDSLTGQTERVSVASDGTQGNGNSKAVSISPEGRYVAFASYASNLVPGDTNKDDMGSPALDVFVHDRVTGQTERVSVASDGTQGNDESWGGSISANGRYVAFCSSATNLVPGDTNGESDIFVRDRQTGTTTRVNVASDGTQAHSSSDLWYAEGSYGGSISADGRYVAFTSYANNLVPGDTNENSMGLPVRDIFVHDRMTGETERVSVASDGTQSNDYSAEENISADGRYVAFLSGASNLVPEDTNGHGDVFVHDRRTGETSRISVSSNGVAGDGYSHCAAISANGRYVAFESEASNLVRRDMNFEADIFIHDRGIPGHNVAINAGPAGDANPAESGADVQCSVTAECSEGHSLSYQWTAEDGEGNPAGTFDDATAQNPAWTAPVNDTSASVDYTISVTVTCSEGAEASGSFTQTVYPAGRPPAYICVNDHPDDNGTQMDLVWPASPDDGSGSDTVTGYNVFRKPRGGTMVFVGSVDAVDAGPYEYTDTGLQPQTLYYYAIRAVSETGASGAVGRWRKTVNDQLPPPGDITDLDAHDRPDDTGNAVEISWGRSPDDGAGTDAVECYHIFRRRYNGGAFIHVVTLPADDSATYDYLDTSCSNGPLLQYAVRAYDGNKQSTPIFDQARSIDDQGRPGPPVDFAASWSGDAAEVTWKPSDDDGQGDDDVEEYWLWRRGVPGGQVELVGIIDARDATSYTRDDTPGSFDGCEYFIRAWDGANASESAYTICWKDASSSSAMVTTAQVQQVNGERLMITYSLSSAADISVEIRNIAGRMVRQIPCGTETAGVNSATWNLRNTSGAKVPSGTYLCTITARSDDGTQATAVRTMQITR